MKQQQRSEIYTTYLVAMVNESSPEDGLLGELYVRVWDMVSLYLAPITGKELNSDELNDITYEVMYMDKERIGGFIKKYGGAII